MALLHVDITLTGGADQLYAVRKGIRQVIIQNPSGNGPLYIGGSSVSSASYGQIVAAGTASSVIGPFSGDAPVNTNAVYVSGTTAQTIHALIVTH